MKRLKNCPACQSPLVQAANVPEISNMEFCDNQQCPSQYMQIILFEPWGEVEAQIINIQVSNQIRVIIIQDRNDFYLISSTNNDQPIFVSSTNDQSIHLPNLKVNMENYQELKDQINLILTFQ